MSRSHRIRQAIRGLYGIADAATSHGDPARMGALMLEGGCRLLQLRAKAWSIEDTTLVARELVARCREHDAIFIVNDSAEIAASVDADGVHVGQLDGTLTDIRRILGPERILGRSTHAPAQVAEARRGADYLAFGPVFPTPNLSRPKEVRGIARLQKVVAGVAGDLPVVAIGGIGPHNLEEVRAVGVDAWAVIGAIANAPDPRAVTQRLCRSVPSSTDR